ncbi:MAG: 16S rRNA (cytosine(967)-C(5))-methyltransferase RsmB [Burkholderiales bacterium]|nr:16S rRNA (cytosine(967)-C(5))-methyltransferase RsmB [Burkholderiales bacterium]
MNPDDSPRAAPAGQAPALARLLEQTADAVQAVRGGRSLTDVLAAVPAPLRPGTQALSFLVLRRLGAAEALRAALAPRRPPPEAEGLLLSALALLWPDEAPPYPDHTLVDQAVTAARRRAPRSAAFLNAVLRRFVRERDTLVAAALQQPVARWNHPQWWLDRLKADWPAHWQGILAAAQARPPMCLRVNARQATGAQYLQRLASAGLAGRLIGSQAIVLDAPVPVDRLPGFADGAVSVQDAAAQRAAELLVGAGLPPGARVLDACAAPGGKTAHLLELADLDVLALDADPQRLARVDATLARLRLPARTRAGDGRRPADWWDGRPFDAILLDAPCSASGIVRRHPDIRWLRRAEDIDALGRVQAELLDALWPTLKPGGWLLYATCSVFRSEGEHQIDAFLQRRGTSGAHLDGRSPGHLLPLPDNGSSGASGSGSGEGPGVADGFYYALLRKEDAAARN